MQQLSLTELEHLLVWTFVPPLLAHRQFGQLVLQLLQQPVLAYQQAQLALELIELLHLRPEYQLV